jgi:hypothetical protein
MIGIVSKQEKLIGLQSHSMVDAKTTARGVMQVSPDSKTINLHARTKNAQAQAVLNRIRTLARSLGIAEACDKPPIYHQPDFVIEIVQGQANQVG